MNKNRQLFINLITTLLVLIVNIGISFGLSRYVVDTIGEEAYGFVALANNFVMYATIFTVAINSMAGRFITISMHRGKEEEASKYFSSVLIANVIIILALIIPATIMVAYLDHIVKISSTLVSDIKLLFIFVILNFFVSLIGGVFSVATYCTNKLYLTSIKNMESIILKAIIIVGMFMLFKPAVFYIGIATLIAGTFLVLYNIKFTKELLPEIKIKKSNFSWPKIKELVSSGLWNSINSLGNVLADGLDLLISNLAIDGNTMGLVALSKTPGNVLGNVISNVSNVFQPQIISYYSKDDTEGVVKETKQGMKITGIFGNIAFAYIIVFGLACFKIWLPEVDVNLLYVLGVLTFINVFCGGVVSPLYNIFTITNKVKPNAILNVGSGLLSTLIVLILIKITTFGAYAIVGVSALIGVIKGFIIVPIYVSHCLEIKWSTFIPTILRYILSTVILIITYYAASFAININSWWTVLVSIIICGALGIMVNYITLFNKNDRTRFKSIVKNKIGGKK